MRIHLKIASDGSIVPFNHQRKLTGTIHKWFGEQNLEHGSISLYSYSMLAGGRKAIKGDGLVFENDSSFFISAYNDNLLKEVVFNIQKDPLMFDGLKVKEIIIQEDPDFTDKELFYAASPIFIKRRLPDGKVKHFLFSDKESAEYLTETLQSKLKKAGLSDQSAKIEFDTSYVHARSKVVHYNNVKNNSNVCPVIINGKPETKAFAWNVGVGNSTGIGLGAIK